MLINNMRKSKTTTTMLHTQGNWTMNVTEKFMNNEGLAITDLKGKLICNVSHDLTELKLNEYVANAKLIRAAPELLEALRFIIDRCDQNLDVMMIQIDEYKKAKEAINKATS